MKPLLRYVVPGLVVALALSGSLWSWLKPQMAAPVQSVTCANPLQGCRFELNHQPVWLKFTTAPSALKPFGLTLHATARQVSASFNMQHMDMGIIRYDLQPVPQPTAYPQSWQAQITLPVCVTGQQDWILLLTIDGHQARMAFKTGE